MANQGKQLAYKIALFNIKILAQLSKKKPNTTEVRPRRPLLQWPVV